MNTPGEIMVAQAAREIRDGELVFVGMRLPLIAFVVAKRTHAPGAIGLFELGILRDDPAPELPYTMGDPPNVRGATWCARTIDVMGLLQRGEVDVGLVGGAEIDVHGNLNTTAIGSDRAHPDVQLPGSGGGADIASLAKRLIVLMPHERRRLRERVDFVTSPGHGDGPGWRRRMGLRGGGPAVLITTRAVFRFEDGRAVLWSIHPGERIRDVMREVGWRGGARGLESRGPRSRVPGGGRGPRGAGAYGPREESPLRGTDVAVTDPPSPEVLRIIREYDPRGFWTGQPE